MGQSKFKIDHKPCVKQAICGDHELNDVKKDSFEILTQWAEPCVHKRQALCLGVNATFNVHDIYESCARAEYEAFVDRHLVEGLSPSQHFMDWAFKYDFGWPVLEKMSHEELIATRPQRMRKRYREGLEHPLDLDKHSTCRMFVKSEQMDLNSKRKPPRAIQYRGSTYTANLATYCVPAEYWLSHNELEDNFGFPILTKGRNALELGDLIYKAYLTGRKNIVLADHTAYDAHIALGHLALERKSMKDMFPNDYEDLINLLKKQRYNRVYSAHGIKVKNVARRMSGDANTSLGGSIINYAMLRYLYPDAIIFVNGDDSIIFTNQDGPRYDFGSVGMKTTYTIVHSMEEIEYCQMRPVYGKHGWAMVKNPERVLNRKLLKISELRLSDWMRVTALGELHASPYDPVSQLVASMFLEKAGKGKLYWQGTTYQQREMGKGLAIIPPDSQSLLNYCLAWDITPYNIFCFLLSFAAIIGAQCCQQWQNDVVEILGPLITSKILGVERSAITTTLAYHNLKPLSCRLGLTTRQPCLV